MNFITFEGGEGVGKSSHTKATYEYLTGEGGCRPDQVDIVKRPNPNTKVGAVIRDLILNPEYDVCQEATELLFQADLEQTHQEVLSKRRPFFLGDRWDASAFSYLYAEGQVDSIGDFEALVVERYRSFVMAVPDLTFVVMFKDEDLEEGLKRAVADLPTESKIDSKPLTYHQRVQAGFKMWARRQIDWTDRKVIKLDALDPFDHNQKIIEDTILNLVRGEPIF